jgi:hypothetical protein
MNINFAQYIIDGGVRPETIFLILILPFVALMVSFFRHFIGLKTFGMYESLVIAYALYFISPIFWVGLKFGLPIIFIAWIVSEISRRLLEKVRLHYISKVSLKISIASILILALLALAAFYNRSGYFTVSALPMIIILTLVESVSIFQVKMGNLKTNLISLETLIVAIIAYFVISSPIIRDFTLHNSYLIVLPLIGNFIVGRLSGLRLSEYIRFKNVFKNE